MEALFSQYNWIGCEWDTLRSVNDCFIQVTSQQVVTIDLYSTSADERENGLYLSLPRDE